jgi:regulator of sirC expression with transglutaminase-like and TPR domain
MNVAIPEETKAMVSLLGDRSLRIRNRVSLQLEKRVDEIGDQLQSILELESDPLIRERLTLLLSLGQSEDPAEHWSILRENMSLNLRDGMVAISMMDSENSVNRIELLEQLQALSDEWIESLDGNLSSSEKVSSLMEFLFLSGRFAGNSEDYYSLDNCFIHRILETGKGLPVTLCLLAVVLAEEADLPLYGIGLPLHFIAGHFQGSKGIRFFDCFDGGREVTPEECVNYLHSRGIFFHPQLLSPCDTPSVLQRVLVNIKHISQRKGLHAQLESIERLSRQENLDLT